MSRHHSENIDAFSDSCVFRGDLTIIGKNSEDAADPGRARRGDSVNLSFDPKKVLKQLSNVFDGVPRIGSDSAQRPDGRVRSASTVIDPGLSPRIRLTLSIVITKYFVS